MTPSLAGFLFKRSRLHTQRAGSARHGAALARLVAATSTQHTTRQGRAGQAGQALAIAGSKAGQSSTGNGISLFEMNTNICSFITI